MSWRRSVVIALLIGSAAFGRVSGTSGDGDGSVVYWASPATEGAATAAVRQGAEGFSSPTASPMELHEHSDASGVENGSLVWAYVAAQASTPSSPAGQLASAKTCKIAEDCTVTVQLENPLCVGEVLLYTRYPEAGSPAFPADSLYWDNIQPLLGKRYTGKLQKAYRENYDCVNGQCVWKKTQVQEDSCTYGCLFEPVVYDGRTWQSFCVCRPGLDVDVPLHCGPGTSRFGYMSYTDWTCESSEREKLSCYVGWKCVKIEGGEQKLGCEPLGPGPFDYSATTDPLAAIAYSFLVPTDASGQIEVVALRGGRIIARRPIGMTTRDLLDGSGVLDQGNAYSVALATGLTSGLPWEYARMTSRATRTASAEGGASFASSPWGGMCALPVAGPTGH